MFEQNKPLKNKSHGVIKSRIGKKLVLLFSLMCSVLPFPLMAQVQVPKEYEVGTWSQFKSAAISYTFDDNTSSQLPIALPILDKYDFKSTLFTVTSWSPDWQKLKKASDNGHEVASHTVSHQSLNAISLADQETELKQSQSI